MAKKQKVELEIKRKQIEEEIERSLAHKTTLKKLELD